MNRVIDIQVRLIVGTLVVWFLGAIIFTGNFVSYGIEHGIRMLTYLQGAFIILTVVGWPKDFLISANRFVSWLMVVINRYVFTAWRKRNAEELDVFVEEVEKILNNTSFKSIDKAEKIIEDVKVDDEDKSKWAWIANQFHDLFEVARTIMKYKPKDSPVQLGEAVYEETYATTHTKADGSPALLSSVTLFAETIDA